MAASSSEIAPLSITGLHSYHRRMIGHDYHAPFIYHIILKKNPTCEDFGRIRGDARIPFGKPGAAYIEESQLGTLIAKAIIHLPYQFRQLKMHQHVVMPDHIHMLLEVLVRTDKHLDYFIDSLRERIADKFSRLRHEEISDNDIFLPGYCDKPLFRSRSLQALYTYIRENPHRLAMRMQYPEFFERVRNLSIAEFKCEAYGNLFLLRNPDKAVVKLSRTITADELSLQRRLLQQAAQGCILVSPFISPAEKSTREAAEKLNASQILVTHEAFGERFKPARHDFDLCSSGRLLIISLGLPAGTALTRPICQRLNALASRIALSAPISL